MSRAQAAAVLLVVLMVGLGLRLMPLGQEGLWLDEVFTHGWAYGRKGQALREIRLPGQRTQRRELRAGEADDVVLSGRGIGHPFQHRLLRRGRLADMVAELGQAGIGGLGRHAGSCSAAHPARTEAAWSVRRPLRMAARSPAIRVW